MIKEDSELALLAHEVNVSFMNAHTKFKVIEALLELSSYRKNPLATMEPCWKYVQMNSLEQQLDHIEREIAEARKEPNMRRKVVEVWDVCQASITAMHILPKYDIMPLSDIVRIGVAKNNKRLYYKQCKE